MPGVGDVERGQVRHPAEAVHAFFQTLVRHEPQVAPLVGERELALQGLDRDPVAQQRLAGVVVAGHRDHLERVVAAQLADAGDLEPDHVGDAFRDGLQHFLKVVTRVDLAHQLMHPPERGDGPRVLDWHHVSLPAL